MSVRLGRISYVNMAPVFHRLNADVEEVQGVPTELNSLLLDGQLDLAPISSIEYARHSSALRILPRMCVSSEGAVDSIQLVARTPFSQIRSIAVTPVSATSVVLAKVLLPHAEHVPLEEDADAKAPDRRRRVRSAFEDPTPHYDLGKLWLDKTGLPMVFAVWAAPEPVADGSRSSSTRWSRPCGSPAPSRRSSPTRRASGTAIPPATWPGTSRSCGTRSAPRERAGLYTFFEMARDVGQLEHVPELRFVSPSASRVRAERAVVSPPAALGIYRGAGTFSNHPGHHLDRGARRAMNRARPPV